MKRRKASTDLWRVVTGDAERVARVRKLAKVASQTRKPGQGGGLDPDAARSAHQFAEGHDGPGETRSVSVEEQRERYARARDAELELTGRMVGYYARNREDLQ